MKDTENTASRNTDCVLVTDGGRIENNTPTEIPAKWDLSQYDQGTELILEKFKGIFLVVNQVRRQSGEVDALDVLDSEDELCRLKRMDRGVLCFDVRDAELNGGQIQVTETQPVWDVSELEDVQCFERVGEDKDRFREWVQTECVSSEST